MDEIETDTEDSFAVDLQKLLLPNIIFPYLVKTFSISYSQGLLDGWVPQHSPCCAATSVAGACNAMLGLHRSDRYAFEKFKILKARFCIFF